MSQDNRLQVTMDGQTLQIESGLTILQAARQNGIDIPTLCDFPGLPAHGSCRMCIVEIQGRHNTPTACTTPVEAGMVIQTHSPKVQALRRELIQMLLAEHPSGCLFCPEKDHCDECMVTLRKAGVTTGCGSCPKDGQCELQALAVKYGVDQPVYPVRYRMLPVETHDPFFDRDNNLCILCGRCIRVCEDLHFINSLVYSSRGAFAQVSTAFQRTHLESSCTFCGTCVEVCPTGALVEKTRKWDGKPDCETATTCPFCSLGCQINLLSKQDRVLGSLPNRRAGTDVLCVKGRFGVTELVNHSTRLKQPHKIAGSTHQLSGWDEAVSIAAEKLKACPPGRFELRISAACTNEDLYVADQFARKVMKSRAVCASAQARYGIGLRSIEGFNREAGSFDRLGQSSTVLCLGLEDPYGQSVVAVKLKRAKNLGAKIIHLSTRKLSWSASVDVWLHAGDGQVNDLILKLIEFSGPAALPSLDGHAATADLQRAAGLLQRSSSPIILLGPAILAHPDNATLLKSVETLKNKLGARVITFPDEANLAGALRLGLLRPGEPIRSGHDLDVLYLIGEPAPTRLPAPVRRHPFVISHSLAAPAADSAVDLVLPSTAFSEENGTYIDYAGRLCAIHPAVSPPAEAQPSWMILSQIAQVMGVPGFAYSSVEDIWRAAQAEMPGFPEVPVRGEWPLPAEANQAASCRAFLSQSTPLEFWGEHSYMGLPLVQRVAGLRSLYPENTNGRGHEPNS